MDLAISCGDREGILALFTHRCVHGWKARIKEMQVAESIEIHPILMRYYPTTLDLEILPYYITPMGNPMNTCKKLINENNF